MKKTVLYLIDNLSGIGGAELMLIAPLEVIKDHYKIILVTLEPINFFEKNHFVGDRQYCLNLRSKKDIFKCAKKLKKIIEQNEVTFVHSFLYWSGIVARLACGKKTPHVFSLATMMTEHIYKHKWYSGYTRFLDRITYKKSHVIISPTHEVLTDFEKSIGIKGKSKVLHNFVREDFFKNQIEYKPHTKELKLVAVGNIKEVKNYQVIIDALQILQHLPVSLDIYGLGDLDPSQKKEISENHLAIKLKGSHEKIYEVLPQYDVFVMSSFLEGFGISAAEAMAIGLPLLLSDINALKEITQGNALFFNPYNAQSLANQLISIFDNTFDLKVFSEKGKLIAKENFRKEKYVKGILSVYDEIFENN